MSYHNQTDFDNLLPTKNLEVLRLVIGKVLVEVERFIEADLATFLKAAFSRRPTFFAYIRWHTIPF